MNVIGRVLILESAPDVDREYVPGNRSGHLQGCNVMLFCPITLAARRTKL
jgi:hypothetical protein